MKMLLNEKTKQEKIMNEVQKKRNLFGLGLTSLIAACSTDKATENGATNLDKRPATAPEAVPLEPADDTLTAATVPSNSDGGIDARNTAGLDQAYTSDASIEVTNGQRGLGSSAGDNLVLRIANGDHNIGNPSVPYASVYTGLTATDKYDLVISSNKFGAATAVGIPLTGAIYIFWNIGAAPAGTLTAADTLALKHLKVAGVPADIIALETPEFYKIGGATDQFDMVFGSTKGYNILWDVTKHAITSDAGATNLTLGTSPGILQVQGGALTAPKFTKVNSGEDYDMVVTDATTAYILWDVAEYYNADENVVVNLAAPAATGTEASHGLLTVTGTGTADPEFIKVNNNEGYDVIVQGSEDTYILWDVANYHDAADPKAVNVDLTGANEDAVATHGLLTLTNLRTYINKTEISAGAGGEKETGLIDIDGGGTNDIAFAYDGNTYILFGEKVANIDEESGTAISHTVDVGSVADLGEFYNKAGDDRTAVTTTAPAEKEGFFDFDLDGAGDNAVVENVGYRFATAKQNDLTTLDNIKKEYEAVINPPAADGALSEEAYWDIA